MLGLFGCKDSNINREVENIDVTIEKVDNTKAVFTDYSYIKLETHDECLLENIVKADITDNGIYILSSYGGNIYKFTKEGKFLWKLAKGNGAGELIFPTDFYVDESESILCVMDNYRTIKKYSIDGKYIDKNEYDNPSFLFVKSDYGYVLFDPNLTKSSSHNLSLYDEENLVFRGLPIHERTKKVSFMPSNVFVEPDATDKYFIQHMLSDTIYHYSPKENLITPAFYINTYGKSVHSHNMNFKDSRSFHEICKKEGLIPGISGLSYLNDKFYLMMYYKDKPWYIVYDLGDKTTRLTNHLCFGIPNSLRCVSRNEEFLAYTYRPEEFLKEDIELSDKAREMVKDMTNEDNPVLILFK